jgi:hypothetical protein
MAPEAVALYVPRNGPSLASPPTGGLEMCWTPAEQAGDATQYGLQHLLSRARWDADAVRDDNRGFGVERLRHEDGLTHTFAFGRQLDVRTIRSADFEGGQELTERAVAAYIAKYATRAQRQRPAPWTGRSSFSPSWPGPGSPTMPVA